MDKNRTFVGTVNGKTYDSVADYNKAYRDALCKNGAVTASIELKPVEPKDPAGKDMTSKDEPGVLRYGGCNWPVFDLDKLRGSAEVDEPIMTNFLEIYMSPSMRNNLIQLIQYCSSDALDKIKCELNNLIFKLNEDLAHSLEAHDKLIQTKIQKLERKAAIQDEFNCLQQKLRKVARELVPIQDEIAFIEAEDNITEGADRILKREIEFYSDILKNTGRSQADGTCQKLNPNVTGRTTDKGNPGFILDHDQKEIARRLFKEIFGV